MDRAPRFRMVSESSPFGVGERVVSYRMPKQVRRTLRTPTPALLVDSKGEELEPHQRDKLLGQWKECHEKMEQQRSPTRPHSASRSVSPQFAPARSPDVPRTQRRPARPQTAPAQRGSVRAQQLSDTEEEDAEGERGLSIDVVDGEGCASPVSLPVSPSPTWGKAKPAPIGQRVRPKSAHVGSHRLGQAHVSSEPTGAGQYVEYIEGGRGTGNGRMDVTERGYTSCVPDRDGDCKVIKEASGELTSYINKSRLRVVKQHNRPNSAPAKTTTRSSGEEDAYQASLDPLIERKEIVLVPRDPSRLSIWKLRLQLRKKLTMYEKECQADGGTANMALELHKEIADIEEQLRMAEQEDYKTASEWRYTPARKKDTFRLGVQREGDLSLQPVYMVDKGATQNKCTYKTQKERFLGSNIGQPCSRCADAMAVFPPPKPQVRMAKPAFAESTPTKDRHHYIGGHKCCSISQARSIADEVLDGSDTDLYGVFCAKKKKFWIKSGASERGSGNTPSYTCGSAQCVSDVLFIQDAGGGAYKEISKGKPARRKDLSKEIHNAEERTAQLLNQLNFHTSKLIKLVQADKKKARLKERMEQARDMKKREGGVITSMHVNAEDNAEDSD